MLLLRIIYVISVLFCYAFMHVCSLMPCGHVLGKGWPLGSRLWCLIVTLSLSHWYPGSGVVLDCIDSWSLPSFLLWEETSFEEFQDDCHRGHLGYQNRRICSTLNHHAMLPRCLPSRSVFYEFQDDCHGGYLGYWNRRIRWNQNLCVPDTSHQVKAQSNI